MNIEASSIHASPVSQPDVPHVSAPGLRSTSLIMVAKVSWTPVTARRVAAKVLVRGPPGRRTDDRTS
jgi:hypothetical protein